MRFFVRHWMDIGGVAVIPLVLWAVLGEWSTIQVILILNFAALLVHQFEEYRFPGGEPWILNELGGNNDGPVDRGPTNHLTRIFINVVAAWPFYVVPILFPEVVWLGFAPILFGMGFQLVVHVFWNNIRLKSLYNPGVIAVLLGHVPLGIWYIVVVYQQNLIHWWDWVAAIAYNGLFVWVLLRVLAVFGPRGAEKYAYSVAEYNRFGRERRLRRVGITPAVVPASVVRVTETR